MSEALAFRFHDRVGLEVRTQDPRARQFFLGEYAFARGAAPLEAPRVILQWGSPADSRPGSLRSWSHKALARWRYALRLDPQGVEIYAQGNAFALPMVHHMMVHPGLRYLSSLQGALLLHASALCAGGRSLAFTGSGGAGKTTVASLVLAYGGEDWRLLADDYVFLTPQGRALSYLTRAHLYRDLLQWLPALKARLKLAERMRLEVFGRLRAWTREGIKWPVRVSAQRLWDERVETGETELAGLVILERGREGEFHLERLAAQQVPLMDVLQVNFNEARHFIRLVGASPCPPMERDWLEAWQAREEKLLRDIVEKRPVYRLRIPPASGDKRLFARGLAEMLGELVEGAGHG